jgi:hypothetical protein
MITFRVGVSLSPFFEYIGKLFSIIFGLFCILGMIKAFISLKDGHGKLSLLSGLLGFI